MAAAEELWTRGAGHCRAAQALVQLAHIDALERGEPDIDRVVFNGQYSVSAHLLIGYGFELLLKAAYLAKGGDEAHLTTDIRHDLVAALDHAERAGFQSSERRLRWIVENLREAHLGNYFRYPGGKKATMPTFEISLPALELLARECNGLIYNSVR